MGDPRKQRKKYSGPSHPWEKKRIEDEAKLTEEYGLKNKKEIWKITSELRRVSAQAKKLIRTRGSEQSQKETGQLLSRLNRLGLLSENAQLEDVLGLTAKDIFERRLQTQMIRQNLASTPMQARQMIIHGHVAVDGQKINSPSFQVSQSAAISFSPSSSFASEEHPERAKRKKIKLEEKKKKDREIEELEEKKSKDKELEELKKLEKEIVVKTIEEE